MKQSWFLGLCFLFLFKTAKCFPGGGYSQVGFSIYKDRDEYERARNPGGDNPHMTNRNDKVVVTYAVGHPSDPMSDPGVDLSHTYYEITPQFSLHDQHQRTMESYRQTMFNGPVRSNNFHNVPSYQQSYQPAPTQPEYYPQQYPQQSQQHPQQYPQHPQQYQQPQFQKAVMSPPRSNPRPSVDVHYSNPYLQVAPQTPSMMTPVMKTGSSGGAPPSANTVDLISVIPFKFKNNPAISRVVGQRDNNNKENSAPKSEVVNQSYSPDAAINAALDDRFPVQYF